MKRVSVMIPLCAAVALLFLSGLQANASPNGSITLSAGQKVKIVANNCTLTVPTNTSANVKVKCVAGTAAAAKIASQQAPITLNVGKSEKISANGCNLVVTKQRAKTVIVVCNLPENSVKVGNGGLNFGPSQITINAGETVHWTWFGNNHTVTSGTDGTADNLFCSPGDTNCGTANASNTGATYDHTFNTPGTFNYFCKIHGSSMSGSVVVQGD